MKQLSNQLLSCTIIAWLCASFLASGFVPIAVQLSGIVHPAAVMTMQHFQRLKKQQHLHNHPYPPLPWHNQKSQITQKMIVLYAESQLAQLAQMTTLSIDSGDLQMIQKYATTGYITDATTNPLFVCQAGLSGDPLYADMVDDAVLYAVSTKWDNMDPLLSPQQQYEQSILVNTALLNQNTSTNTRSLEREIVTLAMDRLAVNLGSAISKLVPGYISTEVDPRLSYDTEASIQRAQQIIHLYHEQQIPKDRILIKLAATWEGIQAAHQLECQYNIKCNLTLIFSVVQAIACAQYNIHLISPFPGRILDWYNNNKINRNGMVVPMDSDSNTASATTTTTTIIDEGVLACREMYQYFKYYGHDTICMPASWRPSRGIGYELDEIQALAGIDRMTIPPSLLERLAQCTDPLIRQLPSTTPKDPKTEIASKLSSSPLPPPPVLIGNGKITESEFRFRLAMDGCGNDKLAEGIRSFVELTEQLDVAITEKVRKAINEKIITATKVLEQ